MFRKLLHYISLYGQIEEPDIIHDSIKQGIVFKGTNLWILVCAIVIASVGLNTNSTAVIIGAMLISPLMGPINGMGYSIAIYDFVLFRQSIKNFGFAVLASLVASTLYFAISPVSTAQSELLARTSPTIYDVLIALFGGGAGIIAITSKQKGNVIPGVAIATALMPPLCTAGYGLATTQFNFFYGAFYLFTINTVCIAFAAIVVSQLLRIPVRSVDLDGKQKQRINQVIWLVIIVTILPSIYFGYELAQNEKFRTNAERYTQNVGIYKGNYLLKSEVRPEKQRILLVYGGSSLTQSDKDTIMAKALDFSLNHADITIEQGLAFDGNKGQSKAEIEAVGLRQEISRLNNEIQLGKQKQDSIDNRVVIGQQLLKEITTLYPQLKSCSYSETFVYSQGDSISNKAKTAIVIFSTAKQLGYNDKAKIKEWLSKRLETKQFTIYIEAD